MILVSTKYDKGGEGENDESRLTNLIFDNFCRGNENNLPLSQKFYFSKKIFIETRKRNRRVLPQKSKRMGVNGRRIFLKIGTPERAIVTIWTRTKVVKIFVWCLSIDLVPLHSQNWALQNESFLLKHYREGSCLK